MTEFSATPAAPAAHTASAAHTAPAAPAASAAHTASVVIPVSALAALFAAQTEQTRIMMEGLRQMTEKMCDTALAIEKLKLAKLEDRHVTTSPERGW